MTASINEATLIAGAMVLLSGIAGWSYTSRHGRHSGANMVWVIIIAGAALIALIKAIGQAHYPAQTEIFADLDNLLFWLTVFLSLAWLFGSIFATREKKPKEELPSVEAATWAIIDKWTEQSQKQKTAR